MSGWQDFPISVTTEFLRRYCGELGFDIGDHHQAEVASVSDYQQFHAIAGYCEVLDADYAARTAEHTVDLTREPMVIDQAAQACLVPDPDLLGIVSDALIAAGSHLAEPLTTFSLGVLVTLAVLCRFVGRADQ